jgi:hypothetical protein
MNQKALRFGKGFRVTFRNKRSPAAEMVLGVRAVAPASASAGTEVAPG